MFMAHIHYIKVANNNIVENCENRKCNYNAEKKNGLSRPSFEVVVVVDLYLNSV